MTFTLRKVLGLFQYKPDFISTDISFVGKRQSPVCFFFVMEILILEDKVSTFETDIFLSGAHIQYNVSTLKQTHFFFIWWASYPFPLMACHLAVIQQILKSRIITCDIAIFVDDHFGWSVNTAVYSCFHRLEFLDDFLWMRWLWILVVITTLHAYSVEDKLVIWPGIHSINQGKDKWQSQKIFVLCEFCWNLKLFGNDERHCTKFQQLLTCSDGDKIHLFLNLGWIHLSLLTQ